MKYWRVWKIWFGYPIGLVENINPTLAWQGDETNGLVVFSIDILLPCVLSLIHTIMDEYLFIRKPKKEWKEPQLFWTKVLTMENGLFTFSKESVNFNTIIRAFAHNQLQWRYIENKLCNYFRVENWDLRIIDAYPGECETDQDYKDFIQRIWNVAKTIADEIHII